jgi:beta-1,4-mannooligosaccharide/beta-1,4-mannosyl-N-acetylglucosamine phosphorylase
MKKENVVLSKSPSIDGVEMSCEKNPRALLTRHPDNPLMHPRDFPLMGQLFNPAPAVYEDKTILLVSGRRFGAAYGGETFVAESSDGEHFSMRDEPFINFDRCKPPYDIVNYHIIDNRVTQIGDTYYILTPVMTLGYDGPATVLGKTTDFKNYELMDVVSQPRNRGASLFPEKINGMYVKLDRPGGGNNGDSCSIWLSFSPDLIHWGSFRPVLKPGYDFWNNLKIGPTPPIRTERGWLVITHGVHTPMGGARYYIGAILLDLNEPWKVIGKTREYLLGPEEWYETTGVCCNVVFPCGALADHAKDELRLYYGGADTYICLATGSLSRIVAACV